MLGGLRGFHLSLLPPAPMRVEEPLAGPHVLGGDLDQLVVLDAGDRPRTSLTMTKS
jgi:hypothetical protein